MGTFLAILCFALVIVLIQNPHNQKETEQNNYTPDSQIKYHLYKGKEFSFNKEELHFVCTKYNPYYAALKQTNQDFFLNRLEDFIKQKDYYIVGGDAYREMPILISAAAIQISFGLREYLCPYFSNIIIHPQEYIGYDPLRILIGNVQGDSITLSWKHFFEDYQKADGKNVGLHEMAHALQVQYLFNTHRYNRRNEFRTDFEFYDKIDDDVLHSEKLKTDNLFDSNALSDPNEFWATSVELFFERPQELSIRHPRLYKSIVLVLNQDPSEGGLFK